MKKIRLLLAMLILFCAMGIAAQASELGEKEQSTEALGELSEQENDIIKWFSQEAATGEHADLVDDVIAFIREKLEAGELATDEDIREAIQEGEEKFDVSLTEEEKEKIQQLIEKAKALGLDPEKLLMKAESMIDEAGKELIEDTQEAVKQSFKSSVSGFFQDMGKRVKSFFSNIFS